MTSYTLIYTDAQLTDCEASRKAYGLSSFTRYKMFSRKLIREKKSIAIPLIFRNLCLKYLISEQRMSVTGAERQDKHGGLTADWVFKYRNEGERLLKEPQL